MSVLIETSLGNVVVDLWTDECPKTCLNFLKLCKVKYFNFHIFHSVQSGFIAQSGDPTGSGSGGESIFGLLNPETPRFFAGTEIQPNLKHAKRGLISMAGMKLGDQGKPLIGSQFFLTLEDNLDYLDGNHVPFGEIAEGEEILDRLNAAYCDDAGRPYQDIRIKHTVILDDPFEDPPGLQVPDKSPEPTKEMLETGRLGADEQIEDVEPAEVVEKKLKDKEAKARQLTLEMIGDLPYADIKPPEHVLFVCKLNPVTRDEDLELIFSRFGKINNCEVIRDKLTGDSLSYAFIEFDEKSACEEAYFKMQNVLIDDRRIHVDFSQSVSKLHKSWIKDRTSGKGLGGFGDIEKRSKYRNEQEKEADYKFVFESEEHGPEIAEKVEKSDRGRHQESKSDRLPHSESKRSHDSYRSHEQSSRDSRHESDKYKNYSHDRRDYRREEKRHDRYQDDRRRRSRERRRSRSPSDRRSYR